MSRYHRKFDRSKPEAAEAPDEAAETSGPEFAVPSVSDDQQAHDTDQQQPAHYTTEGDQ